MKRQEVVGHAQRSMALGSKSFSLASKLFTAQVRESAMLLYAWCRYCDDVIDGQHLGHGQSMASQQNGVIKIRALEAATRSAIAGTPDDHPVFIGLAEVLERHDIPAHYPIEHLAGKKVYVLHDADRPGQGIYPEDPNRIGGAKIDRVDGVIGSVQHYQIRLRRARTAQG